MTDKIFACVKCGQVYYTKPLKKCLRDGIFSGECNSTEFEEIQKEDVLDIHDLPDFLWEMFLSMFTNLWGN